MLFRTLNKGDISEIVHAIQDMEKIEGTEEVRENLMTLLPPDCPYCQDRLKGYNFGIGKSYEDVRKFKLGMK